MKKNTNIKTKKELCKFGVTVGVVFCLLGALLCWRGKGYYYYFLILGGAFIIPALVVPMILRPVEKVWMGAAKCMGWVMTRVILSILFYLVLTPVGLIAKLVGKDFLDLEFDRNAESYWIPKEPVKTGKERYENQF